MIEPIPSVRVRTCNAMPLRTDGAFVLYWMLAARRTTWNYGLQHAAAIAEELQRPLLVLEPIECSYPWACDRFHAFILDGMAQQAAELTKHAVAYYPYVEPARGQARGLVQELSRHACAVIADDYPMFVMRQRLASAAEKLTVRLDAVDSNGLLPMRLVAEPFVTARSFRTMLRKTLPRALQQPPMPDPLARCALPAVAPIPAEIAARWPLADRALLEACAGRVAHLPIDHSVAEVQTPGGQAAARDCLDRFVRGRLDRYHENRNVPDDDATSRLSPYLHFGHISPHEILDAIGTQVGWSPQHLSQGAPAEGEGWWRMSPGAEAFLDQLVTWRELALNTALTLDRFDAYESLPPWALRTLERHASDDRPTVVDRAALESGTTADPIWNAAQGQLLQEGVVHGMMRMLWGKKILEWSSNPREALATLIDLNNKYAIDGRDPNSVSGIFWTLGRYDRPFGPERRVFGLIRYMTSRAMARKTSILEYVRRYAPPGSPRIDDAWE